MGWSWCLVRLQKQQAPSQRCSSPCVALGKSCRILGFLGRHVCCLPIDREGRSQLRHPMALRTNVTRVQSSPDSPVASGHQPETLCSLTSLENQVLPCCHHPGPTSFQEVRCVAPVEGTQRLVCKHTPCRRFSRASHWEDRAGQGEMSGACRG